MDHKPDDRSDNVEKIQRNINHTIGNIHMAENMMASTDNPKTKKELDEKNDRRKQALSGMRSEIKDEAEHREKG